MQLISVGILGEYLGRVYQETKMRPTYVVKEVLTGGLELVRDWSYAGDTICLHEADASSR